MLILLHVKVMLIFDHILCFKIRIPIKVAFRIKGKDMHVEINKKVNFSYIYISVFYRFLLPMVITCPVKTGFCHDKTYLCL